MIKELFWWLRADRVIERGPPKPGQTLHKMKWADRKTPHLARPQRAPGGTAQWALTFPRKVTGILAYVT